MRVLMSRDGLPCNCKLCGFMCMKREQLYTHVTVYCKHVLLAAKSRIVDHSPFPVENAKPHIFGPLDYKAHTPEASLLHWLGVVNEEQTSADKGTPVAATASMATREEEPVVLSMIPIVTSVPLATSQLRSTFLPPVWSPSLSQQPIPSLSDQDVIQAL